MVKPAAAGGPTSLRDRIATKKRRGCASLVTLAVARSAATVSRQAISRAAMIHSKVVNDGYTLGQLSASGKMTVSH